jgi:hypothetical protein
VIHFHHLTVSQLCSLKRLVQNYYGGPIVTDDLIFAVDAGNLVSYESGSTTSYPLTGSLSGSLLNGVGYLTDNGGTFSFDGSDEYISLGASDSIGLNTNNLTLEVWIKSADTGAGSDQWCAFIGTRYGNDIQIGRYSNT